MAAHQAPPFLGFSRQEHWSGLPFRSPVHKSEKWKWSCWVMSDSLATPWIAAFQAPPSMGFSRQEYWSGVPLPPQSVKHLTLANFKTVNYPERKHKIFKHFTLCFVFCMRKEETQPPSFCQTAHLNLLQAVSKAPVSEFPSAAYAMILIIHRFCTANSPTC